MPRLPDLTLTFITKANTIASFTKKTTLKNHATYRRFIGDRPICITKDF
jgi:hypothetical protein